MTRTGFEHVALAAGAGEAGAPTYDRTALKDTPVSSPDSGEQAARIERDIATRALTGLRTVESIAVSETGLAAARWVGAERS